MPTSDHFPHFPALPTELRLQVWHSALSSRSPRKVEIQCIGAVKTPRTFTSSTPPPALLHVNREARLEALKIYKPAFQLAGNATPIYIDYAHDTIEGSDGILSFLPSEDIQRVQTLVLRLKDAAYFAHFHMEVIKAMQANLRELTLLVAKPEPEMRSWGTAVEVVGMHVRQEMRGDEGWRYPEISIVDLEAGREVVRIERRVDGEEKGNGVAGE